MITPTIIINGSVKPLAVLNEPNGIKHYTVNALREYLQYGKACPIAFGLADKLLPITRNHAAYAIGCLTSNQLPTLARYIDEKGQSLG
ncbi:TPA: hypothetical protein NJ746_004556 [Vibrio parahaemolyticus]|nr:hypothetical protein [Vibrio parahaemolyticus]